MWDELGISAGTAIIIIIALYYVIKWAVKNGIKEAYGAITGKKSDKSSFMGTEKASVPKRERRPNELTYSHSTVPKGMGVRS